MFPKRGSYKVKTAKLEGLFEQYFSTTELQSLLKIMAGVLTLQHFLDLWNTMEISLY